MEQQLNIDFDRLVKLLGMLGSEYPGERAAAAQKASKLIAAAGLTWAELIRPKAALARAPTHNELDHIEPAKQCLDRGHLTAWETDFLISMRDYSFLSERQEAVLER